MPPAPAFDQSLFAKCRGARSRRGTAQLVRSVVAASKFSGFGFQSHPSIAHTIELSSVRLTQTPAVTEAQVPSEQLRTFGGTAAQAQYRPIGAQPLTPPPPLQPENDPQCPRLQIDFNSEK